MWPSQKVLEARFRFADDSKAIAWCAVPPAECGHFHIIMGQVLGARYARIR